MGLRRVLAQIETSAIPTSAIGIQQTRIHIETGVGSLTPTPTYRSFTTAYGSPPNMDVDLAGTITRHMAGTTKLSFDIPRIGKGSFSVSGTPLVRFRWYSFGF